MAERSMIAPGMQVVTSDGELLGTVGDRRDDGFLLRRMSGGGEERIPDMWIHDVDTQVRLNRTGAEALAGWKSMQFQTSSGTRPGAPDEEKRKEAAGSRSWIVWLVIAAVLLLAAILLLPNLT